MRACKETSDNGQDAALSYRYVAVLLPQRPEPDRGPRPRAGRGRSAEPPREDRHGIPDLGPCIRCNLQIEGSGVSADDVVIDAGHVSPRQRAAVGPVKDVGIRVDRADGFVLRNVTVRHAAEHGIYVLETDGYLLDRFKAFYSRSTACSRSPRTTA